MRWNEGTFSFNLVCGCDFWFCLAWDCSIAPSHLVLRNPKLCSRVRTLVHGGWWPMRDKANWITTGWDVLVTGSKDATSTSNKKLRTRLLAALLQFRLPHSFRWEGAEYFVSCSSIWGFPKKHKQRVITGLEEVVNKYLKDLRPFSFDPLMVSYWFQVDLFIFWFFLPRRQGLAHSFFRHELRAPWEFFQGGADSSRSKSVQYQNNAKCQIQ